MFVGKEVQVTDKEGAPIVKGAIDESGLYKMELKGIRKYANLTRNENINTWHQRLGHLNHESLRLM